ncbi:MAG: phospho-N-acetylmuramoyl-pentapeptide-transferase [Lachnospiraceae bacterium]|nr:phospho-N-acetylmuramoyl-pentapeptide-transferase [Lachnospiraceae bacterium]MBQ8412721.1 phospho-N-acetylmuramoyl-pentapeptide-transferase [Lachnospiraceae bacterium]
MINNILNNIQLTSFFGIMAAFLLTCLFIHLFYSKLPTDQGRDFAHDGKLSAGKPRGAGFVFIVVFIASSVLFGNVSTENIIYLILVFAAMLTGFLDDCSKAPWGEYKKGLLDLVIAVMLAITVINFNGTTIRIVSLDMTLEIPKIIYGILAVILVWVSINVTNCSDGVDGLSGTLTMTTLMTFYIVMEVLNVADDFRYNILLFVVCILGYLWFNATPSKLMMGDAGSRAMGLFIAIVALKTGCPILYIPAAIVLILDGGLGLVKVALLRFLKIHILKNTRTPLHDHVRKVKNWSNTQAVFRFVIIQIVVSIAVVYMVLIAS